MRKIAILAAMVFLTGCANKVTVEFPKPVSGPVAKIIIYRESTFAGAGLTSRILLDGRTIAEMKANKRIELHLTPGMHTFSVYTNHFPISVDADKTYYLCIDASQAGSVKEISLKTADESARRIAETSLLATNR